MSIEDEIISISEEMDKKEIPIEGRQIHLRVKPKWKRFLSLPKFCWDMCKVLMKK